MSSLRKQFDSSLKQSESDPITKEYSEKICSHMNCDHALSVYAMAISTLSSFEQNKLIVKMAKLTSVSLNDYKLTFVTCNNDGQEGLCEMRCRTVPFQPPIDSVTSVRRRLVLEHHRVLAPNFFWIVTDPLMTFLLTSCLALGISTHVIGEIYTIDYLNRISVISNLIATVFGSVDFFVRIIRVMWFITIYAHLLEALYATYHLKTKLKMNNVSLFMWFLLISCVGFPVTKKAMKLVNFQNEEKSKLK